ncbi:MAG: glycosyltransferase [Deltaproteobacteria bacterium]|nr:glycosyltransferase [Deltaproteobacteria bacterium]
MIRVLFVEASSGGVVGGSLTGLLHLIRGLDRTRFAPGMVLYEAKAIEKELADLGVPFFQVRRRRIPKEHALLKFEGYQRARKARSIRSLLRLGRQTIRLAVEEGPTALQLARVIRQWKADVVHLGNGVRANFDGILACLQTGTPCVCHVKGFEKYSQRERWAAQRVDAVVCMTEAVRVHCEQNGIRPRCMEVVYDALDEAAFQPKHTRAEVRRELGIAESAPCVGVIGNIQEWKGQLVFAEAMATVARHVPGVRGLIVGGIHRAGAEYHEQLRKRLAELKLNDTILITGFRDDVADVINSLDVVAHTSVRAEPFGRVILEGMLLAKPVVATAAGGVPELIQDGVTGLLTPPGDAAALAEALVLLLRDQRRCQEIGSRAQSWARGRFSLARHVDEMSRLYESLIKGRLTA